MVLAHNKFWIMAIMVITIQVFLSPCVSISPLHRTTYSWGIPAFTDSHLTSNLFQRQYLHSVKALAPKNRVQLPGHYVSHSRLVQARGQKSGYSEKRKSYFVCSNSHITPQLNSLVWRKTAESYEMGEESPIQYFWHLSFSKPMRKNYLIEFRSLYILWYLW